MPPTLGAKGRMALALDDLTLADALDVLTDRYHPVEVAEAAVEAWLWWPEVADPCACDHTLHDEEADARDDVEAEWERWRNGMMPADPYYPPVPEPEGATA